MTALPCYHQRPRRKSVEIETIIKIILRSKVCVMAIFLVEMGQNKEDKTRFRSYLRGLLHNIKKKLITKRTYKSIFGFTKTKLQLTNFVLNEYCLVNDISEMSFDIS